MTLYLQITNLIHGSKTDISVSSTQWWCPDSCNSKTKKHGFSAWYSNLCKI